MIHALWSVEQKLLLSMFLFVCEILKLIAVKKVALGSLRY